MISKYVKSAGLEVECVITSENLTKWNHWVRTHEETNEAARHFVKTGDTSFGKGGCRGEATELTFWSTNMEDMEAAIRYLWDECNIKTHSHCGAHVHLKVDMPNSTGGDEDTLKFFTLSQVHKLFTRKFLAYARVNGEKYTSRMRPSSPCSPAKYRKSRAIYTLRYGSSGPRYVLINLNSYNDGSRHTVEIRGMPGAETAAEQIRNLKFVLNTIAEIVDAMKGKRLHREKIVKITSLVPAPAVSVQTFAEIAAEVNAVPVEVI
jgi:hypothetical protein